MSEQEIAKSKRRRPSIKKLRQVARANGYRVREGSWGKLEIFERGSEIRVCSVYFDEPDRAMEWLLRHIEDRKNAKLARKRARDAAELDRIKSAFL